VARPVITVSKAAPLRRRKRPSSRPCLLETLVDPQLAAEKAGAGLVGLPGGENQVAVAVVVEIREQHLLDVAVATEVEVVGQVGEDPPVVAVDREGAAALGPDEQVEIPVLVVVLHGGARPEVARGVVVRPDEVDAELPGAVHVGQLGGRGDGGQQDEEGEQAGHGHS
jgi:hypothetical protein